MVTKTIVSSFMTGAFVSLFSGLTLPVQSLGQQRPKSPPSAQVAPQAPSSRGRDACAASTSIPTKPAETRAKAWTCLREGVSNKDADHRTQAIYALKELDAQSDTVPLIEARLQDSDSFVRQAAAKTLGDMQARESAPKLHVALDDKSAAVSFTAALALWRMGDQSGTSILAQVLAGERGVSPGVIHSEWHDMHEQLHNPTSIAEFGAVQAAGAFLGPAGFGVAALEELAKDKTAGVRATSAGLLGDGTDPGDRPLLEEALKDKSWLVRASAAEALGHAGDQSDIEKLMPMMANGHPALRYKAAAAIVRLTIKISTPVGQ
jgi:HEAT repeat protein